MRELDWFRARITALAAILSCAAIWMLTVYFIQPRQLPSSEQELSAGEMATRRERTRAAADVGVIRGDLWADYALMLGTELTPTEKQTAVEGVRAAAEQALRFAPHDSRVWLLVAQMDLRLNDSTGALAALKMSYYTGQTDAALVPARLRIATRSDAITNTDLQVLVGGDLRNILLHSPALKPSILYAYSGASPEGKRFIEDTVKELDPGLLKSLQVPRSGSSVPD